MGSSLLPNIHDFLAKIDPFDKFPSELVEHIAAHVNIRYLAKGEEIHFSAQCSERFLYLIRTGAIEQRMPDGSLRARLGEDDQFGFTFLEPLANAEDGYKAVAIDDSLLYLIPHPVLQELLVQHSEYAEYFASQAEVRLTSAINDAAREEEQGLFYRQVSEIASENIAVVPPEMSIQAVADQMCNVVRSSCAVVKQGEDIIGVITDRDMTRSVVAKGMDLSSPISSVMTTSPKLINADDKVLQAISLMMQYNIRCLPVVKGKQVVGLLTTSHLVHKHRTQALFLIEKIKYASTVESLVHLKSERQSIFEALVESGINANIQGHVMSMLMDAFTRRLIQLAENDLGPAPCDYTWIVAGSHARNEVHILSDQDSAIIISNDVTEEDMSYFTNLAHRVCHDLDRCGYPLCSGKYMASTAKWCQPLSIWKEYYRKWVSNPEYNKLLNISVFLEVRAIYGNSDFATQLQSHLHACIQNNRQFLSALIKDAVSTQPPLGIFNKLVLEKNGDNSKTLNIKKFALTLIIDLARIYSLAAGGEETGTEARFLYAFQHGSMSEDSYKNIIGAYRMISQVRFTHQLDALRNNKEPDNHIDPSKFSSFERKHLKEAFKIINELQEVAKLRFLRG